MSATQIIHRLINTANISLVISGKDVLLIGMSGIKFLSNPSPPIILLGFQLNAISLYFIGADPAFRHLKTIFTCRKLLPPSRNQSTGKSDGRGAKELEAKDGGRIFNIVLRRLRQEGLPGV